MDKYEFNIKVEQIKKLVTKGDFETSMKIADTIDWRRVRNANLLAMISQVYEKNGEYQEAKEVLLLAYERAPIGRRLVFKLTELALKEGSIKEAEDYYREFCDLAPDDSRQYLLRYLILKEKGAAPDHLIHSLERYVSTELDEKWLYELASLYAEAGMQRECVQTCDRIMLMFGLGKYVDKAMELKVRYAPLSDYQLDLVENRDKYEAKLKAVEQEYNGEYSGEYGGEYASEYTDGYMDGNSDRNPDRNSDSEYGGDLSGSGQEPAEDGVEVDYDREDGARFSYEPEEEPIQVEEDIPEDLPEGPQEDIQEYMGDDMEEPMEEEMPPEDIVLETDLHEAHMEEELAQEMSRLAGEDYPIQEPASAQTKVLRDVHNIKPVTQMAAKAIEVSVDSEEDFQDIETEEISPRPSMSNHLMIEAKTPEKGLQMAIDALKKIHLENGSHHQVAKISGSKLSQRGIWNVADKLMGKDLIVEEAGDLSNDDLLDLQELISEDNSGMIVVLIDNPRQMEELHRQNPELASLFECIGSETETDSDQSNDTQSDDAQGDDVQNGYAQSDDARNGYAEDDDAQNGYAQSDDARNGYTQDDDAQNGYAQDDYAEDDDSQNDDVHDYVQDGDDQDGSWESHQDDQGGEDIDEEEPRRQPDGEKENPQAISVVSDKEKTAVIEPVQQPYEQEEEEMELDDFADYACKYASEIDCSITGKSMLALYERIEIMEEDGIPLTRANAEELIEEAADKAEKPSLGRLIKGVFSSKYDKDGLLILKEEHFI